MSTGLQDVGFRIGDYQAVPDKTLYNNIGPQCSKCTKPYRQCECPPTVETPGESRPSNPNHRQAEALEIIAVQLGKIVKHLERIEAREAAAPVPINEALLRPAAVILPGITPEGTPVLDEATLARNEAKKAETLAKLGGEEVTMDIPEIIHQAEMLWGGVNSKSWFNAARASHRCLCAMPSPTWAEQSPGLATYGPGERELNHALNALRYTVLTWARALVHPAASWESSDNWPEPTALREAIEGLKGFVLQEAECVPG